MDRQLQKGQRFQFSNSAIDGEMIIGVGWDLPYSMSQSFVAFFLENTRQIRDVKDLVSFKNRSHYSGGLSYLEASDNEHRLSLKLSQIPEYIDRISLVAYQKPDQGPGQGLNHASQLYIRFANSKPATGSELVRFQISEGLDMKNVLVVGEIYRYQESWRFNAVGDGFDFGIDQLLRQYMNSISFDVNELLPLEGDDLHDDWLNAVMTGNVLRVKQMMELGFKPDAIITVTSGGVRQETTALLAGVLTGNYQIVSTLLEQGANPNNTVCFGGCPLILATQEHSLEIMSLLLKWGADPNLRGLTGGNAITRALSLYHDINDSYPIVPVIELLLAYGGDVNIPVFNGQETTVLQSAALMDWLEVVEAMLAPGNRIQASEENLAMTRAMCRDLNLTKVFKIIDDRSNQIGREIQEPIIDEHDTVVQVFVQDTEEQPQDHESSTFLDAPDDGELGENGGCAESERNIFTIEPESEDELNGDNKENSPRDNVLSVEEVVKVSSIVTVLQGEDSNPDAQDTAITDPDSRQSVSSLDYPANLEATDDGEVEVSNDPMGCEDSGKYEGEDYCGTGELNPDDIPAAAIAAQAHLEPGQKDEKIIKASDFLKRLIFRRN